jgi:uncharacterized protein involved in copper resistance
MMNDMWKSMSEMGSNWYKSMPNNCMDMSSFNEIMRKNMETMTHIAQNNASCMQATTHSMTECNKNHMNHWFDSMKNNHSSNNAESWMSNWAKCQQNYVEGTMNFMREVGEIWNKAASNNFDKLSKVWNDNMNQAHASKKKAATA